MESLTAPIARHSVISQDAPSWRDGLLDATPIVAGYLPYAVAFGMLARQAGLASSDVLLMCLLVYAGASQIAVMGLLQAGQGLIPITLATFLLNARYLLMSSALSPHLGQWPLCKRMIFGFQIGDETFALFSRQFEKNPPDSLYCFAVNITAYLAWALFSVLGFTAGGIAADFNRWGIDFALPAVLLSLWILLVRDPVTAVVGICSAALSITFHLFGLKPVAIVAATVAASAVGVFANSWKNTK